MGCHFIGWLYASKTQCKTWLSGSFQWDIQGHFGSAPSPLILIDEMIADDSVSTTITGQKCTFVLWISDDACIYEVGNQ